MEDDVLKGEQSWDMFIMMMRSCRNGHCGVGDCLAQISCFRP